MVEGTAAAETALGATIGSARRVARLQARQATQQFQLSYPRAMQGIQQVSQLLCPSSCSSG